MTETFKIKVVDVDEINDLIAYLIGLVLDMPQDDDIRPLVRLAQILLASESAST